MVLKKLKKYLYSILFIGAVGVCDKLCHVNNF